jgi:hypothetical protein
VKPRGATPTMVIGWPLMVIVELSTASLAPSRLVQYEWLRTVTKCPPMFLSSFSSKSRPSAG